MANASFTRDEVILALDVLYTNGGITSKLESSAIQNLAKLLQKLLIHQIETKKKDFRTPTGVKTQIKRF